jgi:small subunit ribosomal protein S3
MKVLGLSHVEIERAARNLKINIHSSRPGIIIGKKGAGADDLKKEIIAQCKIKSGDPVLNVFEVKKPDLDAKLVAENIRQQLEKRVSFRRAMKKGMTQAIKAGAKGIKVSLSGRLGGADMSRTERYMEGRVPLHTMRADIDYATAEAYTTYGLTGVKVWIFKGDILTN